MVLAEVGGVRNEVLPDSLLSCREEWARGIERGMVAAIYQFDELDDDHVVEPHLNVNWRVKAGGYGVAPTQHHADNAGQLGARRWDPALANLGEDLSKLHLRAPTVDRETTSAWRDHLTELLGDILPVRIRGSFWWTMGLTIVAIDLIGLENLMLYMYDDPEGLHRLMAFLRDDHLGYARWLEREGLLSLNNENDYIGSGSMGYTEELGRTRAPGDPVATNDLWVLLESQETVGVGPEQFEEFIFPYQRDIAAEFGRCYYGCCEPVHNRWSVIEKLPGLKRVSVSPWCDEEFMAEALGSTYVYSRKPNPTLISTDRFDEDAIRADLARTLSATRKRGCVVELVMKDVHTLAGARERLARWVALAREAIAAHW
jgi:hypothetical protein